MDNVKQQTILALDLGTITGFAIKDQSGVIISGVASFHNKRFEGGGMVFLRYELLGRKRPSFKKDLADLLLFPFYPLRSADLVHTHGLLCHSHCLRFLQKNFASITYLPKNIYA